MVFAFNLFPTKSIGTTSQLYAAKGKRFSLSHWEVLQLILVNVLNGLYDAISTILRKNVEKKALLDNMDAAMLALDEICDDGYVHS